MRNSILSTVVTAAALGLILVAPVQASDPAVKCETSKLKEAGKYGKCRLKAEAKGVKSGEAADYTKCDEKFSEKWEKVEGKAEGACPTNGDVDSMNTRITTDTAEIARLLAGGTIGAAKLMSGTTDGLPETVTIDYVFENFTNDTTVVSLSALDDLSAVFGTRGVDWTFTSISSVPGSFANPSFNGDLWSELVNQAPQQSLPPGAVATVTVTLELLTLANDVDLDGELCNQVTLSAEEPGGSIVSDLSVDGLDPDPGGDGVPEEEGPSCFAFE